MVDDPISMGWRRLGAAVLVRAWRDVHNTNGHKAAREAGFPYGISLAGDARSFLNGNGARWLVAVLDIDQAGLDHALMKIDASSESRCSDKR